MSEDAISRHVQGKHISELIKLAADAERASSADSLLDRMNALQVETAAVLEEVKDTELYGVRLKAIAEMRRNLELMGEITRELNRTPTLNLQLNPEWLQIEALIVQALEPHTEARIAVTKALQGARDG